MINYRDIRFDCAFYNGYKPCPNGTQCASCTNFKPAGGHGEAAAPLLSFRKREPIENRTFIIKTGAMGDVLRTTTLLPALKKAFNNTPIDWVTAPNIKPLLDHVPLIDRLYTLETEDDIESLVRQQCWTRLICLEKDPLPLALASRIEAREHFGFFPNIHGKPVAANALARYALLLGLDDELKFHLNRKPYPQIITEMIGLPWEHAPYVLRLPTRSQIKPNQASLTIGLNTGCGKVFRTKQWPAEHWAALAAMLHRNFPKAAILLLGGKDEVVINKEIFARVPFVSDTGCDNSIVDFAYIVDQCDLVVTSDTLAMHIAIALNKYVVTVIGSTSDTEIELYGRGEHVVANAPCRPCFKKSCPKTVNGEPQCMNELAPETVLAAVSRGIAQVGQVPQ